MALDLFPRDFNYSINNIDTFFSLMDSSKCTLDILKVYFFDMIFANGDRDSKNWGILASSKGSTVVFLDNEKMLISPGIDLAIHYSSDSSLSMYEDLECFLKNCQPEYIDLFIYYLNIITPEKLYNVIIALASKYNIPLDSYSDFIPNLDENILKVFRKNYQKLNEILGLYKKEGDKHER